MSCASPEDVDRDRERGLGVPSVCGEQRQKGDDQFISRQSQIVGAREPRRVYAVKDEKFLPICRTLCVRGAWWDIEGMVELKDLFYPTAALDCYLRILVLIGKHHPIQVLLISYRCPFVAERPRGGNCVLA